MDLSSRNRLLRVPAGSHGFWAHDPLPDPSHDPHVDPRRVIIPLAFTTSANPSFFMPLRLRLWPPSPAALAYLQLTVVCLQTILALCARALHPLVLVPLFLYLGTLGVLIAAILWAFHL